MNTGEFNKNDVIWYIRHFDKYEILANNEVSDIFKKLENVDKNSDEYSCLRDKVINSYFKLVVRLAKDYKNYAGLSFPDAIGEGNVELMLAFDTFDHKKGNRFSTYAHNCITNRLNDLSAYKTIIKHSKINEKKLKAIIKSANKLRNKLKREPFLWELADKTGFSENEILCISNSSIKIISLDDDSGKHKSGLVNILVSERFDCPENAFIKREKIEKIYDAFNELECNEKFVIKRRYGLDGMNGNTMTLKEIGNELGFAKERARQIQAKTEEKLKRKLKYLI